LPQPNRHRQNSDEDATYYDDRDPAATPGHGKPRSAGNDDEELTMWGDA
jgi:hypothetical protein